MSQSLIGRVFEASLRQRFLVLVGTALLIFVGTIAARRLPIDAVPDVTPNQVQVLTDAPGMAPLEVERLITFPVETAMSGLPGTETIRSVSRFGLSVVTVFFSEDLDLYFCRRLVLERLAAAREAMPSGTGTPMMGPISTGLGEIFQFEIRGAGRSLMDLRSILDWEVAPQLKSVPGVVEVNVNGGELKTYQVAVYPERLVAYGLSLADVFGALERNNANQGGGYIEHAREQYLVRGEGLVGSVDDIESIVVATRDDGTPIFVRNVARVELAAMQRQGAVTRDGRGEVVTGVVMMLVGESSRSVAARVREKVEAIARTLPPGVTLEPYYDRTELVNRTVATVARNLGEGALLVVVVLFLVLGSLRGGLVVATAIPLAMLFAAIAMRELGISGNLMSLGALDFGLIVDGSVVMIENIIRHLGERYRPGAEARLSGAEVTSIVAASGREVLRPISFAVGIIVLVYLPLLSLTGVEGKMFRPMALTVIFALIGSLVLSLTLMPVLATFVFTRRAREEDTWLIRWAKRAYEPLLTRTMGRPGVTAAAAAVVLVVSGLLATTLGAEFVPRLDEGALAIQAWRLPSMSLSEATRDTTALEAVLRRFPEVRTVVSRSGRAEIATDPMGVEVSDIYVGLAPHEEWRTASSREALIAAFDEALRAALPGSVLSYSQPIELRVQELIAGVRSDVAITIFGPEMDRLARLGADIVRVLGGVAGAADAKVEQIAGAPYLRIIVDREAIARYGINAADVLDTVAALGGRVAGEVFEGPRRFALVMRVGEGMTMGVDQIRDLRVADRGGRLLPLGQLAEIRLESGAAQISRENLQRRLAVEVNVRGRDLASFVADAQQALAAKLVLPPGYRIVWGGQFENLQRASDRLALVVPATLLLIFLLLYWNFGSVQSAVLIYLNVPLAATGGVLALAARGMPLSISAGVGFIALFGVAVLNGVVLMSYILQLRQSGEDPYRAAWDGAMIRLRPVLMTALVASLGFLPMALSASAGAEVQRPLATVVIGGLTTSTMLTLLVLPSLYHWIEAKRLARASATRAPQAPIEALGT